MTAITQRLLQMLWQRHGSPAFPAEWDGNVYGGGRISQRFWEYHKAIELLDLDESSIVLDIGGGSPTTGLSFFPRLLADAGLSVYVLDVNFGSNPVVPENVTLVRGLADESVLYALLSKLKPSHVSCISVLEHATPEQQKGIFDAIERAFEGKQFVITFEFHELVAHVEQILHTKTLSSAVSGLNRYYLSDISSSPLHCVNAFTESTRLWYPMALRFSKCDPPRAEAPPEQAEHPNAEECAASMSSFDYRAGSAGSTALPSSDSGVSSGMSRRGEEWKEGLLPIDLKSCHKILLIKLDSIGDFILSTPFLRGLRQAVPHAQIDLLVAPQTLPLAELCPYVDCALGFNLAPVASPQSPAKIAAFAVELTGSPASKTRFLADYGNHAYDIAVVPRWDADMGHGSLICAGSRAPRRVGFSVPDLYAYVGNYHRDNYTDYLHRPFPAHEVEHNAALLQYLTGIDRLTSELALGPVDLWIDGQDMATATSLLKGTGFDLSSPVLAICPGAAGANRRMPASKLVAILKRFEQLAHGVQFVVLGLASEQAAAAVLCSELSVCKSLCGRTSLREMTAVLSRVNVAVTMDSAPAHMAAATETPLVVFSPHPKTANPIDGHSPIRFGPRGKADSVVLQPEEAVWPCKDRCVSAGPNCLLLISDELSAQAIQSVLMRELERHREKRQKALREKPAAPLAHGPDVAALLSGQHTIGVSL